MTRLLMPLQRFLFPQKHLAGQMMHSVKFDVCAETRQGDMNATSTFFPPVAALPPFPQEGARSSANNHGLLSISRPIPWDVPEKTQKLGLALEYLRERVYEYHFCTG